MQRICATVLCNWIVPPALVLQQEVQQRRCLSWICRLARIGKVQCLTWTLFTGESLNIGFFYFSLKLYNCPGPCLTRSQPLERSKRSQSLCRKSRRKNRIVGRGRVKSTMMINRISVVLMILRCYQLAVFIFGFCCNREREGAIMVLNIETKYVVDLNKAQHCVEKCVEYIIVSRACYCWIFLKFGIWTDMTHIKIS